MELKQPKQEKANLDNHANQLNPNNEKYAGIQHIKDFDTEEAQYNSDVRYFDGYHKGND